MKYKIVTVTLLSAAALVIGCSKEPSASQQIEKIKTETNDASQDMKEYTFAQKAEFVEKMQGELAVIDQDLGRLDAKIEKSSDAVKAEARPKLHALRRQEAQLKRQLEDARNATESTWDSVEEGSRKAYETLKDGFEEASQWISNQFAP